MGPFPHCASRSVIRMSTKPYILRVTIATILVISILVAAWFVWQIRSILLILAIGILFGAIVDPLIVRLRRIGLTRGQALLLLYVLFFAIIGTALYYASPLLVRQISNFDSAIPEIFENLKNQALSASNGTIRRSAYRAISQVEQAWNSFRSNPNVNPDQAFSVVNSVLGASLSVISALIVTFYWTVEKVSIKRAVLGLFPFSARARAHAIWDEVEFRIGGWARGQLMLMIAIGIISGTVYYAIDLRFWLALAIFAGITEVIPYIGPILAGAAAAAVALTESPQQAILVIILVFAIQQLEGALLVPRIMKHAVGMTPLTVILAVLIGNQLGGPAGSIIAIPIGASVQVVVSSLLRTRDNVIDAELSTLSVQPLSPNHFDSPFVEPGKSRFGLRAPEKSTT